MKLYIDSCLNCPCCAADTSSDDLDDPDYLCLNVFVSTKPTDAVPQLEALGIIPHRKIDTDMAELPSWCPLIQEDITLTVIPPKKDFQEEIIEDDILI